MRRRELVIGVVIAVAIATLSYFSGLPLSDHNAVYDLGFGALVGVLSAKGWAQRTNRDPG